MQYASALTKRGDVVDVIALRRDEDQSEFEAINGVNVFRVQCRSVNEKTKYSYAARVLRFLVRATFFIAKRHLAIPYQLVHVHNVPDFLVFGALFAKLDGVPVILDIHDLLPEFYASKFKISHNAFLFRVLVIMERCCSAFANHVIVANHLWCERFVSRSARRDKCSVVRNYPDLDIFVPHSRQERDPSTKFMLTYPGSLNSHQGLDVAIHAFARIASQMPETEFHIYGEGPARPSLIDLARELQVLDRVIFHDFLSSREIARVMADTDLAVEPKRATSAFGNEALSTKILEFMALGVPIVASRTKIHAYYYSDSLVEYYDNDDETALAALILALRNNPDRRRELARRAQDYAAENNWQVNKQDYLLLVDSMVSKKNERGAYPVIAVR
jgi:glycosyltransferase involved in cell wall biosynthesis